MKYLLKNITILSGTQSNGTKYNWLQADLFNDEDIFGNPARLPRYYCMTDVVIDMYQKYAVDDTTRPGIKVVNEASVKEAIAKGEIGDILHINQIHAITMPLPAEYARIYRTQVKDATTGAVLHDKGDYILAEGQTEPVPVSSITLHIKKYFDSETNEYSWVEDPHSVLRRVLERNYKPYTRPGSVAQVQVPSAPESTGVEMSQEEQIKALREQLATLGAGA